MPIRLLLSVLFVLLAGCATTRSDALKLRDVLYNYQGAVRWGGPGDQLQFVQPDLREKLQPKPLQVARMEQYEVTGYYPQGTQQVAEDEVRQVVEIRIVNKHSQVERSLIDRQVWRWSATDKAWWRTSPLPDYAPD